MRNAHLERWYGHEVELLRHLDEESTKYAAARSDGNFDVAAVIAGERLEAGSCVYQPPAIRHRELTHSDDLECSRSLCLPQMEVP